MDLDHGDLVAGVVELLAEGDDAGLLALDEVDELGHPGALDLGRPVLELVGGDEDQRADHGVQANGRLDGTEGGVGDLPLSRPI
jgi:hypothetical protein